MTATAVGYHRRCGGIVEHRHWNGTYYDPPEDQLYCTGCGDDVGDENLTQCPEDDACLDCGEWTTEGDSEQGDGLCGVCRERRERAREESA